jgi:hypothetical protein
MDVSSPGYMFGSWVLWSALILPTMYLNNNSDPKKAKDEMWKRIAVVFGQALITGGVFAAAPAARALLMNPIPPLAMGSMLYVLKYIEKSKPFDKNELVKWVAISSLIATIAIPQMIAGVKRGNFVGGEYSGLKPGTFGYTAASFFVWGVMILPMIKSRFESAAEQVVEGEGEGEGEEPEELSEAEKKIAELQAQLGEDKTGIIGFFPIIAKLLVVAIVASIPLVQAYISNPLSPVIAIVVYVALRTARLVTDVEAAVLAAVALIPQLQTLLRNPIPPIIMITMYLFMKNIGVNKEKIIGNTGLVSFITTVIFQVIQDALPSILSTKGAALTTGTSFYNNISFLAWLVLSLPSIYFFLRGRNEVNGDKITLLPYNKNRKGFKNIKEWQKDSVQLIQLIVLYLLATGIQTFRGLFMNPVPPAAMLGLLAFTMWVQSNNPDADYPDNEGLTAIIAGFGFGANFTLADPILKMIFKNSGGAPPAEPEPVVFPPEPVISPISEPVAEPVVEPEVQSNKITNTNSNGKQ